MATHTQSRQFRASLPANRTNTNAIGYDLLAGNGRGGNPSASNFNNGLTGRNSLGPMNIKNGYGQRAGSVSMGVELYYGGNRRVGTPHHTNKRGALRRGLSSNKPSLAAIQNTQNALVASLNNGNASETAIHSQAAARLASHLKPLGEQNGTSSKVTIGAAAANNDFKQQKIVNVEKSTPAQTAAAAAAAVVASAKSAKTKKSVRWSNILISEVPMAMKTSHRNDENIPVNSILLVGGQADYSLRYPGNKPAREDGVPKQQQQQRGEQCSQMAGKATSGKSGTYQVESDSAAAAILPSSSPSESLVRAAPPVGAPRPHTSGALESSMLDRRQLEGTNGNMSRKGNNRHVPLLEMRRNQSQRPSLSEQLAAITADADALTKDIRSKGGLDKDDNPSDPAIVVLPAKSFSVGTLCCRYPSPTRYYRDRIEYTFHHPYENSEVLMVMHYCDMVQAALTGGRLKFKLPRRLVHFSSDFDPNNPTHVIAIELGTSAASAIIKEKIMPLIGSGQAASGFIGAYVRKGF